MDHQLAKELIQTLMQVGQFTTQEIADFCEVSDEKIEQWLSGEEMPGILDGIALDAMTLYIKPNQK